MATVFDLMGKGALITGGNSGIGLGMATALAEAGASVAIWGTNPEKNAAALAELEPLGPTVAAFVCDVGDEEQVEATFAATVDALGRVDSCFANAGVGGAGTPFVDLTLDEWHRVMRVNLDGAFTTLRASSRHMIDRGDGGRLVVTSSGSTIMGAPRNEAYAASKAALLALVKALGVGMARYGITANAVIPGWIETPMTETTFASEKFADNVMPRIPQRRWGGPEDFAGVAVYLASDESQYHTGDTIVIDGGYSKF